MYSNDGWFALRVQLIVLSNVSNSVIAREFVVALGEVPLWRLLLRAVLLWPVNLESLNKHDASAVTSVSQCVFPLPVSHQEEKQS